MKVKISGDGARMSHSSSLFVCSFSLLEEDQKMLSGAGIFFSPTIIGKVSFSVISVKQWFYKTFFKNRDQILCRTLK